MRACQFCVINDIGRNRICAEHLAELPHSLEDEGCPITISFSWVSSSFSNRSSMGPSVRNLSRSHGKRSPAWGASSGRPSRDFDKRAASVVNACLGDDAKRDLLDRLHPHRKRCDPRKYLGAKQTGKPAVGHNQSKCPVRGVQEPLRNRHALFLVRIEQRRVGSTLDDEREFPSEVVRVLQAGVHPLRADRTMNVCSVAKEEATPVTETQRASMMNAIRGKPGAALESQTGSGFAA